jgi:hypothetical protein
MKSQSQYELVLVENGIERQLLESGLDGIKLHVKNRYGVDNVKVNIDFFYGKVFRVRKLSKNTLANRNRLRRAMHKARELHDKYRKMYDKCLLANDRVVGAVALYYCEKTRIAKRLAYDAYIGALS